MIRLVVSYTQQIANSKHHCVENVQKSNESVKVVPMKKSKITTSHFDDVILFVFHFLLQRGNQIRQFQVKTHLQIFFRNVANNECSHCFHVSFNFVFRKWKKEIEIWWRGGATCSYYPRVYLECFVPFSEWSDWPEGRKATIRKK